MVVRETAGSPSDPPKVWNEPEDDLGSDRALEACSTYEVESVSLLAVKET
jgi:hypothetical protein